MKIKIAILCFFSICLFGCGYSFAPRGENIDNRIRTVYVESFENKTAQAEIENYFRTAFINQFIQNSRFKVVSGTESADAIVRGKIDNFNTSPLSYVKSGLAAEERATITIDLTFEDTTNSKIIWSSKNMTKSIDYSLNEDINLLPSVRKRALRKLANDMTEKAFNLMMSGF
ncbi:MAG: hypothetical protein APR62_12895 [Smithella sp. SDB]|nr:MAG: hypothetical protein APR62_05110 [Smithella sp. SDB]KQC09934.1 MAG: hypothetical protein APR62_12895 [Smithella sp. SDB]